MSSVVSREVCSGVGPTGQTYGEYCSTRDCGRGDHAGPDAQDLLARELRLEALRLRGSTDDCEDAGGCGLVGVGLGRDLVGARTGALDLDQLDRAARHLVLMCVDVDVVLNGFCTCPPASRTRRRP